MRVKWENSDEFKTPAVTSELNARRNVQGTCTVVSSEKLFTLLKLGEIMND